MIYDWIVQVIIAVVLAVASYLIAPRPDGANLSQAMDDLEAPTAEAGRPIAVPFGTVTVKSLNTLWFGNRSRRNYKVKVGGGKK